MAAPTHVRYRALSWLVVAAALAYLCRNAVGVAESTIRADLDLTLPQSGFFMGAFFWSYAVCQIPSGTLAQKTGTRIALTAFAIVWSVATLGIGVATAFWVLITAQLMMGIAQAGIFPASCNSVGHWMPLRQRAIACGLLAAGMQVGGIIASGLTGELTNYMSWRWVFAIYTVPGILWAIGFYFLFCDRPEDSPNVNGEELKLIHDGLPNTHHNTEKKNPKIHEAGDGEGENADSEIPDGFWAEVLTRPVVWLLCSQQVCRAAGYMFFASWFPTFLQKTRGIEVSESGYLQGLVLTGTLLGGVLGGWLSDKIWLMTKDLRLARSVFSGMCLMACGILILIAWFVTSLYVAITLLTLGSFFAAVAGPGAFSATIDISGKHVPQVFGLMNMMGNFAAAACPIVVGQIFSLTENWNLVLVLFAIIYLVGAVSWFFVDPHQVLFSREQRTEKNNVGADSK